MKINITLLPGGLMAEFEDCESHIIIPGYTIAKLKHELDYQMKILNDDTHRFEFECHYRTAKLIANDLLFIRA